MKNFLLLSVLLLSANWVFAQHVVFRKTYSVTGPTNQGSAIIQQANGDFIVCGMRSAPAGGGQSIANIYLFRIDGNGDTVWTKEIGTASDRELAYGMTQLPNGNLVIAGSINIPPAGLPNALILCTDISGNVIWQKEYGGNGSDHASDVKFDGEHIIVCGRTDSYGAGNADAWLLKLNVSGDTLWTKTFGGAAFDDSWGIVVAHNQYLFTGGTYSFADGLFDDAWVVKTDTSGVLIWRKTYGMKDKVDWAWNISPVTTGGIVDGFVFTGVKNTGEAQPASTQGDLHLVKIDTAGIVVWDKSIPGTPWRREGFDVQQLPDGGFIICGYKLEPAVQSQQMYIVRTNSSGVVIWDTAYGILDSNYASYALTVTHDGGWAITGAVFNPMLQTRYFCVTRFSPNPQNIEVVADGEANLLIYPNPVHNGRINIKTSTGSKINRVRIRALDGKLLSEHLPETYDTSITLNEEIIGMFIIEVFTGDEIVRRKMISMK